MLGILMDADVRKAIVRRNTVNASRWVCFANLTSVYVSTAKIPRKRLRKDKVQMISLKTLLILLIDYYHYP